MDALVSRLRAHQKQLTHCMDNFSDLQKRERMQELVNELRRLEERALFTSVENVQVVHHYSPEETKWRAKIDESNITPDMPQQLIQDTLKMKHSVAIKAAANRVLANILRLSDAVDPQQILLQIQSDRSIDPKDYDTIYKLVMEEYSTI